MTQRTLAEAKTLIRAHTRAIPIEGLAAIQLWQADELTPIWQATQDDLDRQDMAPPFWAFAWAGGQAVAKYIFEHEDLVRGRRVLDLATGSGLVAIASALCGATAFANDIDPLCEAATMLNAELNRVEVGWVGGDLLGGAPPDVDILFAGDVFYERDMSERFLAFLLDARLAGVEVYVGDPGRTFFPREKLTQVAEYAIDTSLEIENAPVKAARVWKL